MHDFSILDYLLRRTADRGLGERHQPLPRHAGEPRLHHAVLRRPARSRTSTCNWLAPVKVRQMLIGGTKKMIVYDDLEAVRETEDLRQGRERSPTTRQKIYQMRVGYRTGDMWAPQLDETEALQRGASISSTASIRASKRRSPTAASACASSKSSKPPPRPCEARGETIHLRRYGGTAHDPVCRSESAIRSDQAGGRRRRSSDVLDNAPVRARQPKWRRSRRNSRPIRGASIGIGVNTGTSALHLALLAAGIGRAMK